jgi:regulator of protease activity HflC (stomatin/prohibitin superfamily)
MNLLVWSVFGAIVLLLVFLALSAIRIVQQYERGVIFVLGRLTGAKGPGLFLVPPLISHMSKVDLRIVTLTVPPQEVITRDNVTIKVDTQADRISQRLQQACLDICIVFTQR